MLELVNQARAATGLPRVTMGDNPAAQLRAENALATCTGSHWDVDGLKPYMRYSLAGDFQSNTENGFGTHHCFDSSSTVFGYAIDPTVLMEGILYAMEGCMRSPIHKDNILDPWHRKVNIGLARDTYNLRIYQHFEGDYVRYDSLPRIDGTTLSLSGRLVNGLHFSSKDDMALLLYYDQPPRTLTRGQIARAFCYTYGSGNPIAAFLNPLTWSEWESLPPYSYSGNCPDPYDISPDTPAPRSPEESLQLFEIAQQQGYTPRSESIVPLVTASEWTASQAAFTITADIGRILAQYGPGVYTIRLFDQDVPVSTYSIFYKVKPPTAWTTLLQEE